MLSILKCVVVFKTHPKTMDYFSIKVVSSFKGDKKYLKVSTRKVGASCGITFKPDSGLYLIFAYEHKKEILDLDIDMKAICYL